MTLIDALILFAAGVVAGAVNAVAGGGTFLTFGALSVAGIPPIIANATSSITQFPGYITSTLAYWSDIKTFWRGALVLCVISAVGSTLGALILLALDNPSFRALVPWLLLAATALFVLATLYLGEMQDFYDRFWWWDLALHFGSAMGFGILGFLLVFMLFQGDRYAAPPWAVGALSFCLAMTVGVLWEIFEYAMDTLFGFNMMKSGLPDTMGDLIVDAVGAALAALAGVVYLLGRAGRLGAPFELFIATNRTRFRKVTNPL